MVAQYSRDTVLRVGGIVLGRAGVRGFTVHVNLKLWCAISQERKVGF